jgi:polysaccharide biosynthesis PFTS motif protein
MDSRLWYAPLPLSALARGVKLSLQATLRVGLAHLGAPFNFIVAVIRSPVMLLLAQDFANLGVVRKLDQYGCIEAILLTTSAVSTQPLWMRGFLGRSFDLEMAWYSQNCVPLMYVGDPEPADQPSFRHMRIDRHWVWTEGFASYLRRLGSDAEIRVVGPILWYLPENSSGAKDPHIRIAVFDVTPLPDGTVVFGSTRNYYCATTLRRFLLDILELARDLREAHGREIVVVLKHKRQGIRGHHDFKYFDFVEDLRESTGILKLANPETNVFDLLATCDVSISMPYSSTAYVGAALKRAAIFYDPLSELVARYEDNEFVHFAAGRDELSALLKELLPRGMKISEECT